MRSSTAALRAGAERCGAAAPQSRYVRFAPLALQEPCCNTRGSARGVARSSPRGPAPPSLEAGGLARAAVATLRPAVAQTCAATSLELLLCPSAAAPPHALVGSGRRPSIPKRDETLVCALPLAADRHPAPPRGPCCSPRRLSRPLHTKPLRRQPCRPRRRRRRRRKRYVCLGRP